MTKRLRAELRGEKSFHIFVLPGAGSQHAQFDPSAWTYRPANAGTYTDEGMGPLMAVKPNTSENPFEELLRLVDGKSRGSGGGKVLKLVRDSETKSNEVKS